MLFTFKVHLQTFACVRACVRSVNEETFKNVLRYMGIICYLYIYDQFVFFFPTRLWTDSDFLSV